MTLRKSDTPTAATRVQDRAAAATPTGLLSPEPERQRAVRDAGNAECAGVTAMSAELLTALYTHLPSGLIVVDTAGRVLFINEAGTRLSAEVVRATKQGASGRLSEPTIEAALMPHWRQIVSVLAGTAVADVDHVLGRQGERRYRVVQVAISALRDSSAQITGAVVTLTDQTERVGGQAEIAQVADALAQDAREALAQTAATLAEEAVTQAQDNRDLTRSNTALELQAELARVADALARDAREALARTADALAEAAVTQARDNRDLTRSNTALELQAELARVADALAQDTREALARTAVVQDEVNRELTRSNSALQMFASVASHDLQEPLRKIQAFGDRLKKREGGALSPQGQDDLERMQGAARRMQDLINALLAFARVTRSTAPFVPVALTKVAREVLSDLETQIERSGGRVEVGTLPTLDADPLQMRQLLQNLLSNALKFHRPEQPPVVTLSAEILPLEAPGVLMTADASAGALCRVVVQDNGIGFEEKHAERIFGIFERLHGRGAYEGTGIGLALCRQIVERHGGRLSATSAPGQGATFVMTLPLRHVRGAAQ